MFEQLSDRLRDTVKRLRGRGRITEDHLGEVLREVRIALLEADVALPVVRDFVARVRERALGRDVLASLSPGEMVIKIVRDELVATMGAQTEPLELNVRPPAVILLAGLQGAGKTTTAGKLARLLKEDQGKRVLVTSADVYRPAAIEQLERLASQVGVEFFPSTADDAPVDIVRRAIARASQVQADVVIVDTAGRLHVDDAMMAEIREIHAASEPVETLFVADSTTGQDAVNSAAAFRDALPLTGVILTKTDGDARGGAALSVRHVTGAPIKFVGTGEKAQALEVFHPDRMARRILGMGDVLSLVEDVERGVDKTEAARLAGKLGKGKGFDLQDFRDQLMQIDRMGGLTGMLDKIPGLGSLPSNARQQVAGFSSGRLVAIIDSMTAGERRNPDIIRGSRKRRIAAGSGTQVQEVNRLLKQFNDMQRMMKKMGKGKNVGRMLQGLRGRMPGRGPF